ncbi:hypothetical protein GPJ56_004562 [Histomonas meleagridis]|uniref:uncharacterized protein n=1 Tax=Histomonas meleagridis TaxID=135588 RepID=UPI003559C3B4|nr:hypothetical protein GPJ56_004562 [Histomonas meleagridis]KAH0800148.1 hypothetical protein GO595_007260 [Histomonas meleagridis]
MLRRISKIAAKNDDNTKQTNAVKPIQTNKKVVNKNITKYNYQSYSSKKFLLNTYKIYDDFHTNFQVTIFNILSNINQANLFIYADYFFKSILPQNSQYSESGIVATVTFTESDLQYFANAIIQAVYRRPQNYSSIAKFVSIFFNFLSEKSQFLKELFDNSPDLQPIFRGFLYRYRILQPPPQGCTNSLIYYSYGTTNNDDDILSTFNIPSDINLKSTLTDNETAVFSSYTALLNDDSQYLISTSDQQIIYSYGSNHIVRLPLCFAAAYFGAESCFNMLNIKSFSTTISENFECQTIEEAAAAGGSIGILEALKSSGHAFNESCIKCAIRHHHLNATSWLLDELNIDFRTNGNVFLKLIGITAKIGAFHIAQFLCDEFKNVDDELKKRIEYELHFFPIVLQIYNKQIKI